MSRKEVWERVRFASDSPPCPYCEEPWCEMCEMHYCDCSCFGPTQDGLEYKEVDGILYAKHEEET